MQAEKQDKTLPFILHDDLSKTYPMNLPADAALEIGNILVASGLSNLIRTSKVNYLFFRPILLDKWPEFALFNWINSLEPLVFENHIREIIDDKFGKANAFRCRDRSVKEYLDLSQDDNNGNRLAYILCSGIADGNLNHRLVKNLYYLTSKKYVDDKAAVSITNSVLDYAKTSKRLLHLYHDDAKKRFQSLFYSYLKKVPANQFDKLLKQSIKEYESEMHTFSFYRNTRRGEVLEYQQENRNNCVKVVALTLRNGNYTSVLSMCVIRNVIKLMKEEPCNAKTDLHCGEQMILQYNHEDHKQMLLDWLREAALDVLNEKEFKLCAAP